MPGFTYGNNDSVTRRQEVMAEIEELWWRQWIVQAFPHLVPFRRWKHEHRNLEAGDIVLVLHDKKIGKGVYKLGRVLKAHADTHGNVRTVTVGLRRGDSREAVLPYIPRALDEVTLGVQRVAVILPVEDQTDVGDSVGATVESAADGVVDCAAGDCDVDAVGDLDAKVVGDGAVDADGHVALGVGQTGAVG